MQIWEIDNIGFFTGKTSIVDDENLTEFDVSTPVNTDETNTFYKPKWTGSEWVEGWTQEEIDEYIATLPAPPEVLPSLEERLQSAEDTILFLLMGGEL